MGEMKASSRLRKFTFYFCLGNLLAVVCSSQHFLWLSQQHSKVIQLRFSALEAYADECEGMERTLSMRGVSLVPFSDWRNSSSGFSSSFKASPSFFLPLPPGIFTRFSSAHFDEKQKMNACEDKR